MEYTSKDIKIIKNFNRSTFNHMLVERYGITVCCDTDPDKDWVNFELLSLKAIYDPTLCVCQEDCTEDCNDCCQAPEISLNISCLPATGPTGTITLNPIHTGCVC
jgi:hypothetical protein